MAFGGKLDPVNPPESILGTAFYTSGYYRVFHFNDFPTALCTLFHFMAVTNWSVHTPPYTQPTLGCTVNRILDSSFPLPACPPFAAGTTRWMRW